MQTVTLLRDMKIKKFKKVSIKSLKLKSWKLLSEYVRRRDKGICFTCGVKDEWKNQQCGHFIHGRDDYENPQWFRCQCPRCNNWLSGNLGIFARKLIELYGLKAVEDYQKYHPPKKWKVQELNQVIKELKEKLKIL